MRQVQYLSALGHTGPAPTTKGEAHGLLQAILANETTAQVGVRAIHLPDEVEETR